MKKKEKSGLIYIYVVDIISVNVSFKSSIVCSILGLDITETKNPLVKGDYLFLFRVAF